MPTFDRCIKANGSPHIWMVRERTKQRVRFMTWEDYKAAGNPKYAVVSDEEMSRYTEVTRFREVKRRAKASD